MKNNWLKCLAMLFTMIFVGNVVAMPQPKSEFEKEMRQRAIRNLLGKLKQKQEAQIQQEEQVEQQLPPVSGPEREKLEEAFLSDEEFWKKKHIKGRYFVYGKDSTSEGRYVQEKFLEDKSEYVRNLIERNNGVRPIVIYLPFSLKAIASTLDVLMDVSSALKLDLETWKMVIEVEKFLGVSNDIIGETVKYCPVLLSLEELVTYFNQIPEKDIFERIIGNVKDICHAASYQIYIDSNVSEKDEYIESIQKLFQGYRGKMIPIRSGVNAYYIPNYKVLKDLNQQNELSIKEKIDLSSFLGPLENMYIKMRLVDFLDYLMKRVQDNYNALQPWYTRYFGIKW